MSQDMTCIGAAEPGTWGYRFPGFRRRKQKIRRRGAAEGRDSVGKTPTSRKEREKWGTRRLAYAPFLKCLLNAFKNGRKAFNSEIESGHFFPQRVNVIA